MGMKSISSFLSTELISFLILDSILYFFSKLIKLSKRFSPLLSHSSIILREPAARTEQGNMMIISREDAEAVMETMGLIKGAAREEDKLKEFMGEGELASMFEEEEPSLEEVEEVFAVFDENGDGSVEAGELQRVLCKLGLAGGMGMESCKEMIAAHDEDGDGRIDFGEFVKLLERSFR